MAGKELFGAFDAAMLRVGMSVSLLGVLLMATLPSSFPSSACIAGAGAIMAALGSYGCHRTRKQPDGKGAPSLRPEEKTL